MAVGRRPKNDAAMTELAGADGALAGTACSLLTERLNTTTRHVMTILRRMGPLPQACLIGNDYLVHHRNIWLYAKNIRGKISLPSCLSL